MAPHAVTWISPAPLWGRFAASATAARDLLAEDQDRPAILRFASDDFMDQLVGLLAADPKRIGELLARPETWRTPSADAPDLVPRKPQPQPVRLLRRLKTALQPAAVVAATAAEANLGELGATAPAPLKLYQPAHQRYYLVAANLVCDFVGFPDRAVASGGREQIGFVLRRKLPDAAEKDDAGAKLHEFAYLKGLDAARWQRVAPGDGTAGAEDVLLAGEELLPLFALNFNDDAGHPRRLRAGLVPVGRREEYMAAQVVYTVPEPALESSATATTAPADPNAARKEQFKLEVAGPWKNLVRTAHACAQRIADRSGGDPLDSGAPALARKRMNDQLQAQSWLILLDFADYLRVHLQPVWDAVVDPRLRDGLTDPQKKLFDWLDRARPAPSANDSFTRPGAPQWAASLRDALSRTKDDDVRAGLEGAVRSFPDLPKPVWPDDQSPDLAWPEFFYLLAGVQETLQPGGGVTYRATGPYESLSLVSEIDAPSSPGDADPVPPSTSSEFLRTTEGNAALLDKLVQLVVRAIEDRVVPAGKAAPLPYAVRLRDALADTSGDPGWFVLRCVYVRCDCGPLQPPVVSPPSQCFQLASFFDPDAPARPIRISLPLDTTPAGMRKYNRGTAFIISDVLCGQIQRAKGLGLGDLVRSVLPWPLHKDLDVGGTGTCQDRAEARIGMICSLSIPIVTICALILLLIIASVLDFIFRWMPYLIMCFPISGLKGKK